MKTNYGFWKILAILVGVFAISFGAHAGWYDASSMVALGMVGNMSASQARVVDPILTNLARGYKNGQFVGMELFPYASVGQRGGKVIQFGKEAFRLYSTARAPGTGTQRVTFGYAGADYSLEQHALEGVLPFEIQEEAQAVPGIDLGQTTVSGVQDIIGLRLEKAQADLARNVNNYGANNKVVLSGTDQFSDYVNSKPSKVIRDAVEAIRTQIGKRPTKIEIGAAVFAQLQEHPLILDRTKFTSKDSITPDILAALWNVPKVVVGDAIYEDGNGAMQDVWGKDIIIAYTQTGTIANRGLPSFGYTYRLGGYPIVEQPYYDRNSKSWIYPVTDEVRPVVAGFDGGFLIKNAVA